MAATAMTTEDRRPRSRTGNREESAMSTVLVGYRSREQTFPTFVPESLPSPRRAADPAAPRRLSGGRCRGNRRRCEVIVGRIARPIEHPANSQDCDDNRDKEYYGDQPHPSLARRLLIPNRHALILTVVSMARDVRPRFPPPNVTVTRPIRFTGIKTPRRRTSSPSVSWPLSKHFCPGCGNTSNASCACAVAGTNQQHSGTRRAEARGRRRTPERADRRKPHKSGEARQPRFVDPMIMISERPPETEAPAVPGH